MKPIRIVLLVVAVAILAGVYHLLRSATDQLEPEPIVPQHAGTIVLITPLNAPKETAVKWTLNHAIANVAACTFHNGRKFGLLASFSGHSDTNDLWSVHLRVPDGSDVEKVLTFSGQPVVLYASEFERVELRLDAVTAERQ